MAQMSSGRILRETRERKGYDLTTVARRLRIRPDILRAIESGDFSTMPPRGYARNMVNAYARLLGLNPTEIVNMYLDEVYAHQVEKARGKAPSSGFVMDRESRRSRLRSSRSDSEQTAAMDRTGASSTQEAGTTRRMTRHLYDDRTQYSRDDYGVKRDRIERPDRSDRDFMSHHSGYNSSSYSSLQDNGRTRRRERTIHVGQTPMEFTASRIPAVFQSRLAVGIAIAAVILLVFVIVFFVFLRGGQAPEEDVSQLPVSGISDTTGTEDEEEDTGTVEVEPTSARIVYSVESGVQCYVEIYENNTQTAAEMLDGPEEKTAETTGNWTIVTPAPDNLKVTVNGEEVQLSLSEDYEGLYSYTVDFPTLLNEWRAEHGSKTSRREAAVANAENAANEAKSSSSASASASSASTGSTQQSNTASDYANQEMNPTSDYADQQSSYYDPYADTTYYDESYYEALYGDAYAGYYDDGTGYY